MPAIRQNKLIPLMAIVALIVVGFIFWRVSRDGETTTPAGTPLTVVPALAEPASETQTGFLSGAKNVRTTTAADADTPTETIRTLTSEVSAMRSDMQKVADENRKLNGQVNQLQFNKEQLKGEIKSELQASMPAPATPVSPAPADGKTPGSGTESIFEKNPLLGQLPAGFGFDKSAAGNVGSADAAALAGRSPTRTTILPLGVSVGKGTNGQDALVRTSFPATPRATGASASAGLTSLSANPLTEPGSAANTGNVKAVKKDTPYFTIPENATLMGATAMTAIVGRIPVDGRVQDPMQFKLLLGPNNLAANGHFLPRDLSGIVVSGIAIGDMNLSCSEGIVQSMTFVFNDGAVRTVSMRSNGTMPGLGGQGQGQQAGLVQTAKLGYLSDRYGNPCIAGEFKTNAPEYLSAVVGLKTLSLAGKAYAAAQTASTSSAGFGGVSTTSTVTGSKGSYVLGEAASGATDEVTNWITRRMSNSFDAVVTMAGADVVVHIDQSIAIDKMRDARFLDYGQDDSANSRNLAKGTRHGLD